MVESRKSRIITQLLSNGVFWFFCLFCVLPFILVFSISISNEESLLEYGYSIIPRSISLSAYKVLFTEPKQIVTSYIVTITVALTGTFFNLFVNSLIAYPLSRKDFAYRGRITVYILITMLFSGGLVPSYVLIAQVLKLKDTFWVLFLPGIVSAWNIIIFRTFMQSIPHELIESAIIDGAGEFTIYSRIIVPISKPAFATLGLFAILGAWNDWFTPLLYIENDKLLPIQALLQRNLSTVEFLKENASKMGAGNVDRMLKDLPTESTRMALAILVVVPMLLIFPFFQKYFVSGLTIGAIKG